MSSVAVSRLPVDEDRRSSIGHRSPIRLRRLHAKTSRRSRPAIDEGTVYPADLLRRLGDVGAWGSHRPSRMARPICAAPFSRSRRSAKSAAPPPSWRGARIRWPGTSTNSGNPALIARFGDAVSAGKILGGTGLSNPMKTFFGIEKLKLKGRKVEGGYVVRGALPWVSNLGPDHFFGTIFEIEDRARRDRDVSRRLFRSRHHAAAVQAVPRDGRHRHLWRAVPRRLRARRSHPRRAGRAVRQENPRRLHPAAGRHGARPDQGLHRHHE